MDGLLQDLRYGLRMLRTRLGLTVVAVLTLALGIGANTAIFSAVNALLLRPLPVADAERLVFGMALREGKDPFGTSFLEYRLYRDESRSFVSTGLASPRQFNLVGWGEPERLRGTAVMASYLATLGIKPALGRIFLEDEDRPGGPAVAIVSHDLWQRRFGGDPGAIGRTLDLAGRSHTIVGVMPPGFDLPYAAQVWVPMQIAIGALPIEEQAVNGNEFVGRLAPGVELARADAELKALARRLEAEQPQLRHGWSYGIVPFRQQLLGDLQGRAHRSLLALTVAVGFLLLICCANVGSLLLARGVAREGEIAIRRSLGAGRGRLVRQLLTENLLLAFIGGAAGVLLAFWIQPLLRSLNPIEAFGLGRYLNDFRIDWRVLAYAFGLTVATGAISGLAPILRVAGPVGLMSELKRREQRAGVGAGGRRSLAALVVLEIAIAAPLLVGGGLMVQSFRRLQGLDLGFRPEKLLTMELPLSPQKYPTRAQEVVFMDEVLARVRALPGVEAAGMTTNVPLQRGVTLDSIYDVEGRPPLDPSEVPITAHRMVMPGTLETLGVTLVAGRFLDGRDTADALPVAVVTEALAAKAWPGEDPLGKRLRRVRTVQRGPWMTVVGVVKDVKEDRFGFRIDRPVWYVPYAQQTFPAPVAIPMNLVVRSAADPTSIAATVRAAVSSVDAEQPVANFMPMPEYLADVLVAERFSAVLMATLAALGLALSALGLYGVMAYFVGRRTAEIGLRMALGANPRDVLKLVIGQGAALIAVGLALGIAGAFALTRLLASTLYEVRATDPATFGAVALGLALVGLLACWLPARRATRIDPMVALRGD